MSLPPVIERELRGAARRSLTYWARLIACVTGMLVVTPFLLMMELGARSGNPTIPTRELGPMLFTMFSMVAVVTAVGVGWFFASDAIAHERREGTFELLFLAPLKPWEVVLSKLVAVTWRGAQWLLAIMPLFALPILLGGVQGSDFVRLALVVANTLFWSAATSLWASARSKGVFEALVVTVLLQSALVFAPLLVDLGICGFAFSKFKAYASLISPIYTLSVSFSTGSSRFWPSFGAVHASAWIALALTVRTTARLVRQNPVGERTRVTARLGELWKFGGSHARTALRLRLANLHPVRWLVERERGPLRFLTFLPLVLILLVAGVSFASNDPPVLFIAGSIGSVLLSVAVVVLLALQASRFLVEARRTGAMELMLVSPLSTRVILAEQTQSLIRTFALPIGVLMAAQVAIHLGQQASVATLNVTPPPSPFGPGAGAAAAFADMARFQWLALAIGMLVGLTGYAAIAWVGFWMGMACRQVSTALFATIAVSKVIPMISIGLAQSTILPLVLSNRAPGWFPAVFAGVCGVGLNLGLVFFARHQLLPDLRRITASPGAVLWPALPLRRPPTPPVLTR